EAEDVLKVPTAALRFRPPQDDDESGTAHAVPGTHSRAERDEPAVYVLSRGRPERVAVETGLSDDVMTAVSAPELKPGDRVITRVKSEPRQQGWTMFGGRGGRGRR